jgi:hypothetical protein
MLLTVWNNALQQLSGWGTANSSIEFNTKDMKTVTFITPQANNTITPRQSAINILFQILYCIFCQIINISCNDTCSCTQWHTVASIKSTSGLKQAPIKQIYLPPTDSPHYFTTQA